MGLNFELSHLVYAELYRILATEKKLADPIQDRLSEIELDHDWLSAAYDAYDAKWRDEIGRSANASDMLHLDQAHAQLASWILVSLRGTGHCFDLSQELRGSVTERFLKEVTDPPTQIPSAWKPVIQAWTLGMVTGQIDHDLPAIPPTMPKDDNIRIAYEGLIEHLLLLGELPSPWPEIAATSVHWRGSGLLEAMQPEAQNAPEAMGLLVPTIRRHLPELQAKRLSQHFSSIVQPRNSLTHIADTPNSPRFVDVVTEWSDDVRVKNTVMGVTQLLFAQYSAELFDSRAVNTNTWEILNWDLKIYD